MVLTISIETCRQVVTGIYIITDLYRHTKAEVVA
jgi:hypothetical protein